MTTCWHWSLLLKLVKLNCSLWTKFNIRKENQNKETNKKGEKKIHYWWATQTTETSYWDWNVKIISRVRFFVCVFIVGSLHFAYLVQQQHIHPKKTFLWHAWINLIWSVLFATHCRLSTPKLHFPKFNFSLASLFPH